ncbi:MAG: hypothetical protein EB127_02715 [Alphaproteobacteria bacterium]|nr:hypothetical protein [Alphaproteobacteria bacterium]
MNPLILVIVTLGVIGLTSSLLLSLNKVIKTIYYWEREITFIDHSNPKEIHIRFPCESLTSDVLSKDIESDDLHEKFQIAASENNNVYVPYSSLLSGIVDIFLGYRNVIGALQNAQEEYQDDPEELELFKGAKKFDFPSVISGLDTYNMYTKYTLHDLDTDKEIQITSADEYSSFVRRVIENKSNLSYRTHYLVYKKIGNKEDGQLISELITTFNIGLNYQNLSNHIPSMEVTYLPENKDARKNS